jgi:hypothetical protein
MFCFRQGLYSCWYGHVQNTVRFENAVLKVGVKVSCGKNRNVAPLTDKSALYGGEWSASSPGRFIHTFHESINASQRHYPFDIGLGGPQRRSGSLGEQKIILSLKGIESRIIQPVQF